MIALNLIILKSLSIIHNSHDKLDTINLEMRSDDQEKGDRNERVDALV